SSAIKPFLKDPSSAAEEEEDPSPSGSGSSDVAEFTDPFQRYVVEQFAALESMMTRGFDSLSRKIEVLSKKIDDI
ncbi:hypothetical protein A2U01_0075210, partial [Trifolium medium]|nr:hypothetical protein [Trifolium medium]